MKMTFSHFATAASTAVLMGLSTAAPPSAAQAHVEASGDYIVRASTVSAENLPDAMRQQYGIGLDPNTAVLHVTVQRRADGQLHNVPAQVDVRARNLIGVETRVDMRKVVANDMVNYMGTYTFLPREVLAFEVSAQPEGERQPITLQFQDRLGRR